MHRGVNLITTIVVLCFLAACTSTGYDANLATPPADSSLVGTWRFASAGDQKIVWPCLIKFDKKGACVSGPTPFALTQKANYTFDGKDIIIGLPDNPLTIPDVTIKGKVMQFQGEDDGEPILLTYHRISRW
jgi:hypothetical protein